MIISKGSITDIEAITDFQIAMALESEGTRLDRDIVSKGVSSVMEDESKGIYIVAKESDIAIGSLMITREWSDWNNAWYWWIQSVYVMPEYRGRGVFKAMYAKVKELAGQQNVSQIRLYVDRTNTVAQRIYEKLGMAECHYLMYEADNR